jgi:hypothetical protein
MADDKQSTAGMVSGLVQGFIAQLRAVTGGLEDLAGFGERRPLARGAFPLPGALFAVQLTAISSSAAAQRRSIEALKAQLSSFGEQLAVLEQILYPLTGWSRTWAEAEERLLNVSRGPAARAEIAHYPPRWPALGTLPVIGSKLAFRHDECTRIWLSSGYR